MAPWFPMRLRRVLADIVPLHTMKKLMHIIKIMDINARQVIQTKRDAISKGETAVKEQIAEGKDIMSILRIGSFLNAMPPTLIYDPQCAQISKKENLIDCQILSSSE